MGRDGRFRGDLPARSVSGAVRTATGDPTANGRLACRVDWPTDTRPAGRRRRSGVSVVSKARRRGRKEQPYFLPNSVPKTPRMRSCPSRDVTTRPAVRTPVAIIRSWALASARACLAAAARARSAAR